MNPPIPPADLEIQVSRKGQNLTYILHSPSGATGYNFKRISGTTFQSSPEVFRTLIAERIEKLNRGRGADDELLRLREIRDELEDLGRWLYHQLFPPELKTAYRRFRGRIKTLQITSDEPWIPWEMVKPFDSSDPESIFEDDFLCMQFELTRWLAGDVSPAAVVSVNRLAVLEVGHSAEGATLVAVTKESDRVKRLAGDHEGLEDISPESANFETLKHLLTNGRLGLLHFAGHADFAADQPDESRIDLEDRPFRPQNLTDPQLRVELRHHRPLIFLNACRTAQQGWSLTGLGGWANAWVRDCGCGALVAPRWKVSDHLAMTFADAFYSALEEGHSLGQSTRRAREVLRDLQPGLPTWLAYSIYAHPNGLVAFGKEEPPQRRYAPATRRVPSEIRKHIIDNSILIEDKTRDFIGRRWVFELIDRFVATESRGYFLLLGDPGIGKTALLAEQVKRKGHLHHFNLRTGRINRPETFLANICAQLIATYGLECSFLPPEATRDARFLNKILGQVSEKLRTDGGKAILLVDALDEVEIDPTLPPTGANTLYLPSVLPQGIYVVATSRRTSPPLRIDCEYKVFALEQDAKGNVADIEEYVESRLAALPGIHRYLETQGLEEEAFIAEMVAKSQGNFMYLHHVLPEISGGVYQDRDVASLPDGLLSYYQDHWNVIKEQDLDLWFEYKLPVLVALTIVREPIPLERIQKFSRVGKLSRIHQVLEEWAQFLYVTSTIDEKARSQKYYRIYHASFQDFVLSKGEVRHERVDLEAAHGAIADTILNELYPGV